MDMELLRALIDATGVDNATLLRTLRQAVPDLADACNSLLVETLPSAQIGIEPESRVFGRYDREAIDASAEREGTGLDWFASLELSRRPNNGRSVCQLDYQRALRAQWIVDNRHNRDRRGMRQFQVRHPYARHASIAAYGRICRYFAEPDAAARAIIGLPCTRGNWERGETPECLAARKVQRARRDIIRVLGALASAGNRQAARLFAQLQPVGTTGRMRR
jgi:hypothetical protein